MRAAPNQRAVELVQIPVVGLVRRGLGRTAVRKTISPRLQLEKPAVHYGLVNNTRVPLEKKTQIETDLHVTS